MTISNPGLESDLEADAGRAPSLRRAQWERYAHHHQSRSNLLLHIAFVPLFLAGNVAFLIALAERRWLIALGGVLLTLLSIMVQGRGHRQEPVAPEPFTGPRNAMARILLEQWVTFPRFVLSGAWARALRGSRSV
jgi:type IV secretory pathway TrbD component